MYREINSLSQFHPLISRWFSEQVGQPTDVQAEAWPIIARGEHVLISAPTGSGKTLTAFLWALNQLVTESWPLERTKVLYVSPLKALNNDIQRNLLSPLKALNELFQENNESFPSLHVLTRSGDTPQSERRRMVRHPPEILITTPESLNLMLSSMSGRSILGNLSTVILDEIHGVIGSKRGVHLITAVERLVRLSGEFQRIGLSATLKPIGTVAQFIGGYKMEGDYHSPRYSPRKVCIIQSPPSISSAIQHIGRAGHRVGEVSRGTIFPTHSHDFMQAAVLASGILSQDIEEIRPIQCPLDVLAQVIVSMVGTEMWNIESLYAQLRTSLPYRNLSKDHFDLVLNMLHTLWGGQVNRPFAMALDAAWEARFHQRLEIYPGNDCVILVLAEDINGDELLSLLNPGSVEILLKKRLEGSGFFGARFRECAGRALLLPRSKINQRMPLWMSRLRSQKLFNAVMQYNDFPILLEVWRTCLQDEFDLDTLHRMLTEIETGIIQISETYTSHPSPMAKALTWQQINQYMYSDDTPSSDKTSHLRSDLLRDAVFTPGLRPTVYHEIVKRFELKRQRLAPGYSPSTDRDLIDWVKERVFIPESAGNDIDGLCRRIEQLLCYPTPVSMWESEILPARFDPYTLSWLDTLLQQSDLRWIGNENRQISFCFETDRDLMMEDKNAENEDRPTESERVPKNDTKVTYPPSINIFQDTAARYDFSTLLRISKRSPSQLSMELSGEVLSGYFFQNIPGPQFISHYAFRVLQRELPEDAIFRINAADPASCCGLSLESFKGSLPRRLETNHLVYHGRKLVLSSKQNGKHITCLVPPDHEDILEYFNVLNHLLNRTFLPKRRITIETINGEKAARCPYSDIIRNHFDTSMDHKSITLYRRVS